MQVSTVTNAQNTWLPVTPVAKVRRHEGDDSHGRGRSELHRADGRGDGLQAMLKLKVTQTFANLVATEPADAAATPAEGGDATPATPSTPAAGSGLTATIKARLKISFGDDGAQAQIKLRIKAEGNAADLQGLMDRFVGTLQAAIQTLFGTQSPATAPTPATPPAVAAPATPALPAPTDGNGPVVDAAAALPPAAPVATAPATATPAAADTSLKLRAAYLSSSADLGFGALVERLAQPGVEAGMPALAPVLEDLSAQFTQISSLLQPREGVTLSLRSFLSNLAGQGQGQGQTPADGTRSAFSLSLHVRGSLLSAVA